MGAGRYSKTSKTVNDTSNTALDSSYTKDTSNTVKDNNIYEAK